MSGMWLILFCWVILCKEQQQEPQNQSKAHLTFCLECLVLAAPPTHWHCAAQKLKTGLSYKSSQVILMLSLFDQCYCSFDFELDVLLVQWGFCLQIQIDVQHYWATGSDCKVSEYLVIFSSREVSFVVLFQLAEHRKLEIRPWITLCLALVSLSHSKSLW